MALGLGGSLSIRRIAIGQFLWLLTLLTEPAAAVSLLQVDTFEDGSTQGWIVNLVGMGSHPAPPSNEPTGGPGGVDDNFLQVTALGGGGGGSKLTALNMSQWAGDYLAAGITEITLDVRNLGNTDLHLRLAFEDPTVGPPENIAFSSDAIVLRTGGGWTEVAFPVSAPFLTAGEGTVNDALSNTTVLRIYHSPASNFPNPLNPIESIVGQLGVDNICATTSGVPCLSASTVPEPATAGLILIGLAAVARAGMRRRYR